MIFTIVSKKHGNVQILIDEQDYHLLTENKWGIHKNGNSFYVIRQKTINGKRENYKLHREILKIKDSKIFVDHINGNGLDNRRDNLRVCTQKQNGRNLSIVCDRTSKGTSKYKGVTLIKSTGRWKARIMVDYKQIYLGVFSDEVDAAIAYNEAAIKYFGEFARLNNIERGKSD